MSVERIVLAFAGFMILLSLALGVSASPIFHHEYWLWFTAFVGLNLLQSAFTGFSPDPQENGQTARSRLLNAHPLIERATPATPAGVMHFAANTRHTHSIDRRTTRSIGAIRRGLAVARTNRARRRR